MVHLTQNLCKMMARWYPIGVTSHTSDKNYYRKVRWLKLMSHFGFRNRNCLKLGRRAWTVSLRQSMEHKKVKKMEMRDLFSQRIWAALEEHRFPYKYFLGILPQVGIELDRKVLAHMAIFEPRTFSSLVTICQAKVASNPRCEESSKVPLPEGFLSNGKL